MKCHNQPPIMSLMPIFLTPGRGYLWFNSSFKLKRKYYELKKRENNLLG